MRKLKLVQQFDQCGCSIACVAMVTDMSYFMVREMTHLKVTRLVVQSPVPPHLIGLYGKELKDLLEDIYDIPCRFVKFSSLRQIKKHCILWITALAWKEGGSHVVVFDAEKRRILDPMNILKNLNEHNVACCLEID